MHPVSPVSPMPLHRSSPWPVKLGILAAAYVSCEHPLQQDREWLPLLVSALLLVQAAVFLPSVLFAVQSRAHTTKTAVLSLSFLTGLGAVLLACRTRCPALSCLVLAFASAHLLHHQFLLACTRPRTFNISRVTAAVAAGGGALVSLGAARACTEWPAQLPLLACVVAGELLGVAATFKSSVGDGLARFCAALLA